MLVKLQAFMNGKKTYTGIVVLVLGTLGVAKYVGGMDQLTSVVDSLFQILGAVLAIYGTFKSHQVKS